MTEALISRKDAKCTGNSSYFTGKPCPKGHIAERKTSTRACRECLREFDRQRYAKNPEKERERSLKAGWKRNKFPEPTRPRPTVCEMCGKPPTARRLHLDHNHQTKLFRGWLCHYCNTNLGRFGDSVDGLKNAILYLQKTESKNNIFPTEPAARKLIPISSGVLNYFPSALAEVAKVSYAGNQQHNPGEKLHWARNKSTDQDDTIIRHFLERGTFDTDGLRHTAKLAWRVLALLQLELEAEGAPIARGAK